MRRLQRRSPLATERLGRSLGLLPSDAAGGLQALLPSRAGGCGLLPYAHVLEHAPARRFALGFGHLGLDALAVVRDVLIADVDADLFELGRQRLERLVWLAGLGLGLRAGWLPCLDVSPDSAPLQANSAVNRRADASRWRGDIWAESRWPARPCEARP
jgi:hypothetical protein